MKASLLPDVRIPAALKNARYEHHHDFGHRIIGGGAAPNGEPNLQNSR
jgi:hypothetical protein